MNRPSFPLLLVRRFFRGLGLHPEDSVEPPSGLRGKALVVATNHGVLQIGKATTCREAHRSYGDQAEAWLAAAV